MATPEKKPRRSITLETKIEVLDCLAQGETPAAVSRKFNLTDSTVRTIKRNEKSIRDAVATGTDICAKNSSYARDSVMEKMEKALSLWIEDHNQKRVPIDGPIIREKALQLYSALAQQEPSTSKSNGTKSFNASAGWFAGFLKRYSLHNVKLRGESASADETAAKKYPAEVAAIIKEGGYSANQVCNADESGLYWKRMPSRTYLAKAEKSASGFKAAKDRVTLLLCSNASGDHLFKPLLIHRSLRPRALKGADYNQLPIRWLANQKTWVTQAVFKQWFDEMRLKPIWRQRVKTFMFYCSWIMLPVVRRLNIRM